MKIQVHVTKEIYKRAMYCGRGDSCVPHSCAVALAIRELIPTASMGISLWLDDNRGIKGEVSDMATLSKMVYLFDETLPIFRPYLPEFSFEVEIPDELINEIGINQVRAILENSKTLEILTP